MLEFVIASAENVGNYSPANARKCRNICLWERQLGELIHPWINSFSDIHVDMNMIILLLTFLGFASFNGVLETLQTVHNCETAPFTLTFSTFTWLVSSF